MFNVFNFLIMGLYVNNEECKPLSKRELDKAINGYIAKKGWKKKLDSDQFESVKKWVTYIFEHPEKEAVVFDDCVNPDFEPCIIDTLCRGRINKIDMLPYLKQGFSDKQLVYILYGLENNFDVSLYANKQFDVFQMQVIFNGLKQGFDVSLYAKPEYNGAQMSNILYGLENGLDVSKYANSNLSPKEMNDIINSLKNK